MSQNNETKWFKQLNILEFRKSLTRYREVDSLKTFYEKANGFLGRNDQPSEPVLPETPEEAYLLGKMLYDLEAYSDSEDWLRKAAEGGIADAQVALGDLLGRGCGRTRSFTEALKWYEAAKDQGNFLGLTKAMGTYHSGGGSYRRGDERCRKAVENTTPEERGKSPEKLKQVEAVLRSMADEGDLDAEMLLESEKLMLDVDLVTKAAENGNIRAMQLLANRYYLHIIPCEDSIERAVYWSQKAAALGDAGAMHSLSAAYANGFGVEYDPEKAFGYSLKAAEQGIVGARVDLGRMYFFGTGVEQSYRKAREWFMTVCHTGEAQYYLGEMYYRGLGVERDDELALEWYSLAQSNGYTEAKVKLAIMYANGHGTEKDSFATSSLLFDAVDEGSQLAIELEGCF